MDYKSLLERSWSLTLRNIKPLILMTLALGGVAFITVGILGPWLMAGYMQSVLLLIRNGREPKIGDIFSETKLLPPLTGFGLAVVILTFIGFNMLLVPGVLLSCGISFICLYLLPLMTDRHFGLTDGLKKSFEIVTGDDIMDHVIVAILFMGISAIGGSIFIGWIFTQPLATLFLLSVYEEKVSATPPSPPLKQK